MDQSRIGGWRRATRVGDRPGGGARDLGRVTYTHVRREHSELADRLVNEALDATMP